MARFSLSGIARYWGRGIAALCYRTALTLVGMATLLSGCARLPIAGTDADRLTATTVARLDAEPLFAASPDGKKVAFSREGVRVTSLPSGELSVLSPEQPLALAWSPDSARLAVAFGRGTGSRILVYGSDGVTVNEAGAAGRIVALFWPGSEALLAVTMELEPYKFGTNCREVLLRWHLSGSPDRTVLHEVTLKPHTASKKGLELLRRVISPSVSPLGDELVYGRIHDPPAFDPYLMIMVRNISSGSEREVVRTGLSDGAARFSADAEELLMDNGSGGIRRIAAWSGAEQQVAPFPGRVLAVSPDRRYLLADGRLLVDGREVARFPPGTTGEFLGDGRLLAAYDGNLFLITGFGASVAAPVMPPDQLEQLRTLRAWRASGLISADDYVTARDKVVK